MRGKRQSARELIESDGGVRRWYENMCRASKLNADVRLRRLNLFCIRTGMTPAELAGTGREDAIRIEDVLLDHVSWLESQGYAPNYVDGILKSVRAWLGFNYVEMRRKIRITNAGIPVRLQDERVPTRDELGAILDAAEPRARASISLMAFAGLRPQVMGNADASDGLRISDIGDLAISNEGGRQGVSFARMPAMVTVRAQLSKTRNRYFTFLTVQGCGYVLGYLRKRIAEGEVLKPETPVIAMTGGYRTRGNYGPSSHGAGRRGAASELITTPRITAQIRKAVWRITRTRPYVLRAYFDTQLLLAESRGKMTHAYRQFFMGHKGDIEARYTTNKGRLTEEMAGDMRRAFSQSEPFLSTSGDGEASQQDRREMLLEIWREQAKMYGIDPLKIRIERQREGPARGGGAPARAEEEMAAIREAIADAIREAGGANGQQRPQDPGTDGPYSSKIVSGEQQLLDHVCLGWEPIRELKNDRVLIRRERGRRDPDA